MTPTRCRSPADRDTAPCPRELLRVFESQIAGGKPSILLPGGSASPTRRFFESHTADPSGAVSWRVDLTPLLDETKDPSAFVAEHIERFMADVMTRITKLG